MVCISIDILFFQIGLKYLEKKKLVEGLYITYIMMTVSKFIKVTLLSVITKLIYCHGMVHILHV